MEGRGGGWNKHLEVTQVDSGLVCSLYQWGPGPWALGVYLSSWGTTAHYSPPIMPHRAPFLCLNWGAVCAPMNYSIYLLCCSEVCLEKLLQTPKCPRVYLLICANAEVFSLILTLLINVSWSLHIYNRPCLISLLAGYASTSMHSCYVDSLWSLPPPFLSSCYMASLWDMWCACYPDRPCLTALIFEQLESVYIMPHPNSAK